MRKLDLYKEEEETWEAYIERFEMYAETNSINVTSRKVHIISLMGAKTYGLLKSLAVPTTPQNLTYDQIKLILKKHLCPRPSKIVERFRFQKRNQKPNESINEYVVELKALTKHCDYGAHLLEALLDKFVVGIRSEEIQKRLLSKPDTLTFDQAVQLATSMEIAKGANGLSIQLEQMEFLSKRNTTQTKNFESDNKNNHQKVSTISSTFPIPMSVISTFSYSKPCTVKRKVYRPHKRATSSTLKFNDFRFFDSLK